MMSPDPVAPDLRLSRLRRYLDSDPKNLRLLEDVAVAAYDAGDRNVTTEMLSHYAALADLPPGLVNLGALIALAEQRYQDAADQFATLLTSHPTDPAIRFNLAWARAMLDDHAGALALLDEEVLAAVRRAASLKIRMLHHLGRIEEALACGRELAGRHADDAELMGVLSAVALDADDRALAGNFARRAGDTPTGLTTVGTLLLEENRCDAALNVFARAIAAQPSSGRAWVGQGLGLLGKGDAAAAAASIDRGAELFGDHLGSWIAAGWAYFVQHDYAASRMRFERALALDGNFAESHGGLAVLDVLSGDLENGERRIAIALRLDRRCFAAALARSLLLSERGDRSAAQRVRSIALDQPIGEDGRTIAQAIASFGFARARRP